jgi:hypothetical protein
MQPRNAAGRFEIRIPRADDDASDAGVEDRLRAWRGRTRVIARLEGHVERGSAHVVAARGRVAKRFDFGMRLAAHPVKSLAERRRTERENGADRRVRRRASAPAFREFASTPQIHAVERREMSGRYGETSTPFQKAT